MNLLKKIFGNKTDEAHEANNNTVSTESADTALPELDEQSEPLSQQAPGLLSVGCEFSEPNGAHIRIETFLRTSGDTNIYTALFRSSETSDEDILVRLREANATAVPLFEQEVQARHASGESGLLPIFFEREDKQYLLDKMPSAAPTLEELFQNNAPLETTLPIVLAATQTIAKLHDGGWMHGALRPEIISAAPDAPLTEYSVVQVQTPLAAPIFYEEYSSPELAQPGALADARSDVYSLGALFYRALAGAPWETIQSDPTLQQRVFTVSGVPQILTRALGAPESRFPNAGELHDALSRWAARRTPQPEYSIALASTIGLNPSRLANEDAALQLSGGAHSENGQTRWSLLAVADGMGGMDAGEVASRAAIQSLAQNASALNLMDELPTLEKQTQWTHEWAHLAASAVSNAMKNENARGGCTLIAALVLGNRLTLAHAGDCRAYVFSAHDAKWQILTRDHSYVATLWQTGEIKWEEMRTHPNRNQITRALGEQVEVPEWFFDSLETATGNVSHLLAPGEVLLLCSDGVWEPVLEDEMAQIIQQRFPDLGATANAILQVALERGAPDNATVALLALRD